MAERYTCLPAGRREGLKTYSEKMFYVYVLQSLKTGVFYKGLTDNIDRRLKEHESGKSPTTKRLLPVKLVYVEICDNRQAARELEKYFKSGFGREIIKEIAEVAERYTR